MLLGLEILADGATVRVVMEAARRKSPAQCCLVASLPLDGIFLDLHGAMVAEHVDDGEGELLSRIRRAIGYDVPISVCLDLHGNITEQSMTDADMLVGYRTYPHIDMAVTGRRAAELLDRLRRAFRQGLPTDRLSHPHLLAMHDGGACKVHLCTGRRIGRKARHGVHVLLLRFSRRRHSRLWGDVTVTPCEERLR
ncbi:hypothetical protein D3C71_1516500 [compost metagenome]